VTLLSTLKCSSLSQKASPFSSPMTSSAGSLESALHAASLLYGLEQDSKLQSTDLITVLSSRLSRYRIDQGLEHETTNDMRLEEVQLETAMESMNVLCSVQQALDSSPVPESSARQSKLPPAPADQDFGHTGAIGTRDLAHLRALAGIVFNWGIDSLLSRVVSAWAAKRSGSEMGASRIIDLTNTPRDYSALSSMLDSIGGILLPRGVQGSLSQTHITSILVNRHLTGIFKAWITLGWLPKSLISEATPVVHSLRPLVMKLIEVYVLACALR
jgi:hypothetical protein